MLLEFTSTRPPGRPVADRRWQRSYYPAGAAFTVSVLLYVPDSGLANLAGWLLAVAGGCLLGNTIVARRRHSADATREPRHWTIDDEHLRAANRLGSVRWTWTQVRRAEEHPDAYLLYQSDNPHTAAFDVPRDTLTPAQDAELRTLLAGRGLLPR